MKQFTLRENFIRFQFPDSALEQNRETKKQFSEKLIQESKKEEKFV